MELKNEHGGEQVSFLDLDIKLKNKEFSISLFDKRDGFPFTIVRMPYNNSNMPSKIFYSSVGAEILRIGRATSHTTDFLNLTSSLLLRMFKQGANKVRLWKILLKMYGRYQILHKFASNAKVFADILLN